MNTYSYKHLYTSHTPTHTRGKETPSKHLQLDKDVGGVGLGRTHTYFNNDMIC